MSDYSSIQDLRNFEDELYNVVDEYLKENHSKVNTNDVLNISPDLELSIEKSGEGLEDSFPIGILVRTAENGLLEPDVDQLSEIANMYLFLE